MAALSFAHVDASIENCDGLSACRTELVEMLPKASSNKEKSLVLWRLSMVQLLIGEQETSKDARRSVFGEGVKYGEEAVCADPSNPDCYMWHCANVGRECQTRSLKDQAMAVPVMMKDITMILETLGHSDYSAAWQALAEIYWNHPFKSDDEALNFMRRAVMTIPSGELRLSSYVEFARMMLKRNSSASKREAGIKANSLKNPKGTIAKYACYDGLLGSSHIPAWSNVSISQLSDKEEAAAVLKYAENLFVNTKYKSVIDRNDYRTIKSMLNNL